MLAVRRGKFFGIDQQPLRSALSIANIEFAVVRAGRSLVIKVFSAPHLQAGYHLARVIQRFDALQQLISPRNPRQHGAGVVILRFHPGDNFRVRLVFKPAIGIDYPGAKVVFGDVADRGLGQLRLGEQRRTEHQADNQQTSKQEHRKFLSG